MIIHNPKISGSLQFPSDENGNLITLQVQNGTLETITLNSSGVDQGIQPAVNYSGSFTGSFVGDGSNLTGVAASDFNIDILDALGGASIAQSDNFLISDAGTEKKVSFTNIEDSIFANVSGDISIAAGGAVTIGNEFKNDSLNSATGSYLTSVDISTNTNLAVSDTSEVNMILSGDTLSAELIGGVISGSSQVSIDASQISDVDAFSQSGNYSGLRAQSTTKGDVGLGNVDNTSDANKPVSTAGQTALDLKANLASPALTGNPTAPTQADNDNSTKIATTAYVQREVSDLLGGAPAAFDTLLEISASIANGDSDVVALTTTVGGKLQKDQNLSDLTNASTARTNLGVDAAGTDNSTDVTLAGSNFLSLSGQEITAGTVDISSHTNLAVSDTDEVNMILNGDTLSAELIGGVISGSAQVSIDSSQISDVAAFSQSGTYASLRAQGTTKGDVGLGNVTNESKSTMFASPTFTGTTAAPTPSSNDDSTKIATTAYVQQELTDLVGTAGSTLDTLGELSASLASDQSGLASLTTTVGTKLAKASNLSDLADAGTARTNLGVDAAGTDNSTDVTLGNTNYLSISGQAITGGTVPIGSGGTGATSAGAARTALGVDAAGTDNSTDVTVAGNTYISLSGQEITAGTVDISSHTNLAVSDTTEVNMILSGDTLSAELIGGVVSGSSQITSIGNSQLSNSSITIDGSAISLGGSITTNNTQLSTEAVQDIVGGMVSSNTESGISVTYDDTGNSLDFSVTSQTDENFTTADHDKLDGIEAGAEVNRTAAETRTLIGTGNGNLVPAAGSSGEFLKHDGTFGTPSYTTNTNTQLTQEQVEDFVGGMLDGTETGITVGYDDVNGNLDFVVASQTDNNFTTTLKNKLDGIAESANNYVLPTNLAGDDIDIDTTALTGATVISDLDINITTNTSGLVTDANGSVSTRTLTASDLGLGNVTNESKSTMFTSPTFTGTTVAPTPSADDNSTKIATTAYVQGELTALIGTAPATLDTLGEISASIANGDSDVVALTTTVGTKLAKSSNLSDLANASTARTNLGVDAAGTINYTHPTFDGDDISVDTGALTGATVISDLDFNITTNTDGHVTDANGSVSTRTLTAGNLGLGSGDDVTFGTLRIDDATASTSKTTGALIVDGGVGIAGALNVGGDVVAYASSDERLKDNIELISNPIERVQALKGVTWDWNSNADELQQSLPNVGVIAQDVEKVLPQLVTDRDNGFKGVDYAKLTGLLIEAVKDQQKQIDELKSKLS